MNALHGLIFIPWLAGCHIASGIDDIKIDTRVEVITAEQFECVRDTDDFVSLDENMWNTVAATDGIDVRHDPAIDGVVFDFANTPAGARAGLITSSKYDFNGCSAILEVVPGMDASTFAMVAVMLDPNDDVPVVALRKEGSQLIATRYGEQLESVPFNDQQLYWRIIETGGQIRFEHSVEGMGVWEPVAAVVKPEDMKAVHIALFSGASANVQSDTVVLHSYEMR